MAFKLTPIALLLATGLVGLVGCGGGAHLAAAVLSEPLPQRLRQQSSRQRTLYARM
ncbi:hypothetical protein [Motilimonas sp. E26]|uniref:hypothetical protein n=1 Tax=Motilimonas sp. E26 TaxID=2865674 RepID=UPI001E5A7D6C|nr:hypothetical protein [Motilimonas sp. E26]MCE0557320.1 hypothetical protein [Motilimonas sp. E26]